MRELVLKDFIIEMDGDLEEEQLEEVLENLAYYAQCQGLLLGWSEHEIKE